MITAIRFDKTDAKWCSAEYMARKIGLPVEACRRFLDGPEMSEAHGITMTDEQAELFSNTDLTVDAEKAGDA